MECRELNRFDILNLFQVFLLVAIGSAMYFTGGASEWNSLGFVFSLFFSVFLVSKYRLSIEFSGYFVFVCLAYVFFAGLAFVISGDSAKVIVGLKYYFYFFPLFLVLSEIFNVDRQGMLRLFLGWRKIFYLQIPFLLIQYQFFFLKTGNWDSLVGTFGGDPSISGNSSGMAIFVLCYAALSSSFFAYKIIGGKAYLLDIASVFLIAGFAEIKIVIFLMPVVVLICFFDFRSSAIARSVLIAFVLFFLGYLVLDFYAFTFYSDMNFNVFEVLDFVLEEFLDPDYILLDFGDLGRVTALVVWWENNFYDFSKFVFGNGVMSIKENPSIYFQSISAAFQYRLGGSALVNLLWDFGLLGTAVFCVTLIGAFVRAITMSSRVVDPLYAAVLKCSAVSVLIVLITLPYSNTIIDTPQIQFLAVLVLSVSVSFRGLPDRLRKDGAN